MNVEAYNTAIRTFGARLEESSRFHMGTGDVHRTLESLAKDLERAGIDYAVVGAMALNAYGFKRETVDVDVLVRPDGLAAVHEHLVGRGYRPAFEGARKTFRNTATGTKVEFLQTGEYPGDGKPKPFAFPDPAQVFEVIEGKKVVRLPVLVDLKLASGMTNPGRLKDLSDVQELIRTLALDEDFAEQLHPYVRDRFAELLRAVRSHPERAE